MALANKEMSQFMVIGLGRFGMALVQALHLQGKQVLAVDISEDKINAVEDYCTRAIIADASDENALRAIGVKNFDAVIVCMGTNMQSSILCTLICKELGAQYLVCKANSIKHKTVLEKIGADVVVVPEDDIAKKIAKQLVSPHVNDIMELTENFSIAEAEVPFKWNQKSLIQVDIRRKYAVNVLIVKNGQNIVVTPDGDNILKAGDTIVVGGKNSDIARFIEKLADL